MSKQKQDVMYEVLERVLEEFAFLFCDRIKKDDIRTTETEFIQTFLTFKGAEKGTIALSTTVKLCGVIANNLLGENDVEIGMDSFKELLNVYAGHILEAFYGEEAEFTIGAPKIKELSVEEWNEEARNAESISVSIEDYPVLIRIA